MFTMHGSSWDVLSLQRSTLPVVAFATLHFSLKIISNMLKSDQIWWFQYKMANFCMLPAHILTLPPPPPIPSSSHFFQNMLMLVPPLHIRLDQNNCLVLVTQPTLAQNALNHQLNTFLKAPARNLNHGDSWNEIVKSWWRYFPNGDR